MDGPRFKIEPCTTDARSTMMGISDRFELAFDVISSTAGLLVRSWRRLALATLPVVFLLLVVGVVVQGPLRDFKHTVVAIDPFASDTAKEQAASDPDSLDQRAKQAKELRQTQAEESEMSATTTLPQIKFDAHGMTIPSAQFGTVIYDPLSDTWPDADHRWAASVVDAQLDLNDDLVEANRQDSDTSSVSTLMEQAGLGGRSESDIRHMLGQYESVIKQRLGNDRARWEQLRANVLPQVEVGRAKESKTNKDASAHLLDGAMKRPSLPAPIIGGIVVAMLISILASLAGIRMAFAPIETVVEAWARAIVIAPRAIVAVAMIMVPIQILNQLHLSLITLPLTLITGPLVPLVLAGAALGDPSWTPRAGWDLLKRGIFQANAALFLSQAALAVVAGPMFLMAWQLAAGSGAFLAPVLILIAPLLFGPAFSLALWCCMEGEIDHPGPNAVPTPVVIRADEDAQDTRTYARSPSYMGSHDDVAELSGSSGGPAVDADRFTMLAPAIPLRGLAMPVVDAQPDTPAAWHVCPTIDFTVDVGADAGAWIPVGSTGTLTIDVQWSSGAAPLLRVCDGHGVWREPIDPDLSGGRIQLEGEAAPIWLRVDSRAVESQSVSVLSWSWESRNEDDPPSAIAA